MNLYSVEVEFAVKTPEGVSMILKPKQIIRLPEQSARPLITAGVIKPLDEFVTMFDEVAYRLSKQYRPGAIGYCRQRHPATYNETITAENRLNALWSKGVDPAEFKQALSEWESIHAELLRLFKKS